MLDAFFASTASVSDPFSGFATLLLVSLIPGQLAKIWVQRRILSTRSLRRTRFAGEDECANPLPYLQNVRLVVHVSSVQWRSGRRTAGLFSPRTGRKPTSIDHSAWPHDRAYRRRVLKRWAHGADHGRRHRDPLGRREWARAAALSTRRQDPAELCSPFSR